MFLPLTEFCQVMKTYKIQKCRAFPVNYAVVIVELLFSVEGIEYDIKYSYGLK